MLQNLNRVLRLKTRAALLALVLGTLLLVSLLFDPNDHKGEAEASFLARTGRVLALDGKTVSVVGSVGYGGRSIRRIRPLTPPRCTPPRSGSCSR